MAVYGMKPIEIESVSAVTATPSTDLGTTRFYGGNKYQYMYNAGAEAYTGAPVWVTGATDYNFVSTYATFAALTAAGADGFAFAGVVQNATCAASSYCWIAQSGLLNCRPQSSAIAVGDMVLAADDGNFVMSRTGVTNTATTEELASYIANTVIGVAQEVATAAATGTIAVWRR